MKVWQRHNLFFFFFFFSNGDSLLASSLIVLFKKNCIFGEPFFLTVSTSKHFLLLQSNQFDTIVTFFEQLFLQSCYFLWNSSFFRFVTFSQQLLLLFFSEQQRFQSETSTKQLLVENKQFFRTATFAKYELVQNKVIYKSATFSKQVLLYCIKFFRTASFSTELILQKRYLLSTDILQKSYFFGNS